MLKVEEKLEQLYGKGKDVNKSSSQDGKLSADEIKRGMLVAARLQPSGHWHRARVVEITYRHEAFCLNLAPLLESFTLQCQPCSQSDQEAHGMEYKERRRPSDVQPSC